MSRPSEPVLRWLRDEIRRRGVFDATIAAKAGLEPARFRRLLAGEMPMTLDELVAVATVLDVSLEDLLDATQIDDAPEPSEDLPYDPPDPVPAAETDDGLSLDPEGNHPRQLFEVAFALQCDFLFLAHTGQLDASGLPKDALGRYAGREIPIKLDAMYHGHNQPRYEDDAITLTLSFDTLYECRFPWTSIRQVVFFPKPVEPKVSPPPPETNPKPRPKLRLVE